MNKEMAMPTVNKTALITGIGGQDGAYLAQLLASKGYKVFGTSRDAGVSRFDSLARLGIHGRVNLLSMAPNDFKSTLTAISKARPDEIYHLAGQTSVGLSFEQPSETIESITIGTLNILEALRFLGLPAKFYHASSSECFGDTGGAPADEHTSFNPVSPYAVAKSAAHWLVRNYREAHKMFATNGILFNHESDLRPARFVTQKVVQAAYRISCGSTEKLTLGDLSISRDWGSAFTQGFCRPSFCMLWAGLDRARAVRRPVHASERDRLESGGPGKGPEVTWLEGRKEDAGRCQDSLRRLFRNA
jgi:GDPmannose 4,6-dehydratase